MAAARSSRRPTAWPLAAALVLLLAGCTAPATGSPDPAPAPAGAASAPAAAPVTAQPLQPVQIAISTNEISFLVFGLAELTGIARSEGLDLTVITASSNVALAALAAGEIGYTGQIGSLMRAAAQGVEARTLAVFMDAPLQTLVVRPDIRQPRDLVGKTIAVNNANSTTHVAAIAMLEAAGVRASQVEWAYVGAAPARFAVLQQGLVQGTALTPPMDVAAERDHGYPILMRAGDFVRTPFVGVGSSPRRIQERPDEVKRVLRTLIRANDYMRQHPAETAEIAARWTQLDDPDLVRRSLDLMYPILTQGGAADRKGFDAELASIQQLAQLSAPLEVKDVADFRLLEEVQRELGLPVGGLRN